MKGVRFLRKLLMHAEAIRFAMYECNSYDAAKKITREMKKLSGLAKASFPLRRAIAESIQCGDRSSIENAMLIANFLSVIERGEPVDVVCFLEKNRRRLSKLARG